MKNHALYSLSLSLSLSLSVALALGSILLLGAPAARAALYLPGETLDPACAPADSNCGIATIVASSTATSIPYYSANGSSLSATSTFTILPNGNIGIGTTTSGAAMTWHALTSTQLTVDGTIYAQAINVQNNASYFALCGGGSALCRLGIGWTDDTVNHEIHSTGAANDSITWNLVDPANHYLNINGKFNTQYGATLGYPNGTSGPTKGLAVNGNVGIGTTSPFSTLQIATTTGKNLVLSDSGAGANLKHWLFSSMGGNLYVGTTTDTYATSTPSALTITNAGNVGIGTTNPGGKLEVAGPSLVTTNYSSNSIFVGRRANGSLGNPSAVLANEQITGMGGRGYGATGFASGSKGLFGIYAAENWTDANQGTYITIGTTPLNSTTLAERMRIDTTGNVGIGTTSPYAFLSISNSKTTTANTPLFAIASTTNGTATTTVFSIASTGDVTINGSSGSTCTIGNGTGATSCTSDERLKANITSIPNALHDIAQIRGVTFNWADPAKNQSQFIGVVAQDVQKVFPQAVSTIGGYLAVDYAALIAPLIEAVKELAGKVSELAATVAGFADSFTSKNITASQNLCLGSTCVTESQLKTILQSSGQQTPPASGGGTITITDVPPLAPPEAPVATTTPADTATTTTDSTPPTVSDIQTTPSPDITPAADPTSSPQTDTPSQ
jgi:hypothetical protein